MKLFRRKSVTINWRLQGGLCLRICFYWLVCLALSCLMFAARPLLEGTIRPDELMASFWADYCRPLSATLLMLPLILVDSLIYSNRVAGPLYRFNIELEKLNRGENGRQINLRPNDFGQDVAEQLNQLIVSHCEQPHDTKEAQDEPKEELASC